MPLLQLPIAIDDLLKGRSVEWERLEYKKGWNPEAVLHTICAFANDIHNLGGGYILVGVEEIDGRPVLPPVGIPENQLDGIQKELLNLGHTAIQPAYHPICSPVTVGDSTVLVIWVPGGATRPYKARVSLGEKGDWAWYIRKQSSTVKAKGSDERDLLALAANVPFDDRPNQQTTLDDLNPKLLREFLKEVGSELNTEGEDHAALCRQMNLADGPDEALFPKNVGLLFFNEHPEKFFPATQIDVLFFPDGAGGDQFEEKEFKGPLSQITREALSYIQRNYLKQRVIKHPDRAEADRVWNFAYVAIEEAVVNAVYHRSYEIREPVEIRIDREEIAILSFPGPDRSIKLAQLQNGKAISRCYRNRRIGEFLKELELTEGRSTGIPKMLRATQANGSPDPVFETDDDHTHFITRLPIHPAFQGSEESPPQVTPQVTPQATPQVTPQVNELLRAIQGEQRRDELMGALGLKDRKHFRKEYLEPALKGGWLELTQPDSPKSPTQRYRLTEKGYQWQQENKTKP